VVGGFLGRPEAEKNGQRAAVAATPGDPALRRDAFPLRKNALKVTQLLTKLGIVKKILRINHFDNASTT
jgi:hypothetical protein